MYRLALKPQVLVGKGSSLTRLSRRTMMSDSSSSPKQARQGKVVQRAGSWLSGVVAVLAMAYAGGKLAQEDESWRESLPGNSGDYLIAGAKAVEECLGGQGLFSPLLEQTGSASKASKTTSCDDTEREKIPSSCKPQPGVVSALKSNAVFLTIHLESKTNLIDCAVRTAAVVEEYNRSNQSEATVAIGFSEKVWNHLQPLVPAGIPMHRFEYKTRRGEHGQLPATGGDIFFHMKSDDRGECFSMAQKVLESLPTDSIYDAEDVYGFAYKNDHDLFGYKLRGTHHDTLKERVASAVVPTTGASYALVQQWRHRLYDFKQLSEQEQDAVIGKNKIGKYVGVHSVDLEKKPHELAHAIEEGLPANSHVARMIGVDQNSKRLSIVRQSMPFGNLAPGPVGRDNIHEPGLMFLAYCNDPLVFTYMCERMVGTPTHGSPSDSIMKYSQCLRGQLYIIPSSQQLASLAALK